MAVFSSSELVEVAPSIQRNGKCAFNGPANTERASHS